MVTVPAFLVYLMFGALTLVTVLIAFALVFFIIVLRNLARLSEFALEEARDIKSGIEYVKEIFGISIPL